MKTEEQMRRDFESWALSNRYVTARSKLGHYTSDWAQAAWTVWQAATKLAEQKQNNEK